MASYIASPIKGEAIFVTSWPVSSIRSNPCCASSGSLDASMCSILAGTHCAILLLAVSAKVRNLRPLRNLIWYRIPPPSLNRWTSTET